MSAMFARRAVLRKSFAISGFALLLVALVPAATTAAVDRPAAQQRISHAPPRSAGYFTTKAVGAWRTLPGDKKCRARVHTSTWEPRPDNAGPNHTMPRVSRVHAAFKVRPMSKDGSYNRKWDRWLLPRVTGHDTGTTDEIFQWAACKWGISDNVLRAIAVRESTWYQYEIYPSRRCVIDWGCGDMIDQPSAATRAYCTAIGRYGHDYQADFGTGICPETFSIAGVMSWQAPSWGKMRGNQNGTFPFNRNSTAFAVDYLAANLRGCYEGWISWLAEPGRTPRYSRGDLWGCVGFWYAGEWKSSRANGYIGRVKTELRNRTWLESDWKSIKPSCSAKFGCPRGS